MSVHATCASLIVFHGRSVRFCMCLEDQTAISRGSLDVVRSKFRGGLD